MAKELGNIREATDLMGNAASVEYTVHVLLWHMAFLTGTDTGKMEQWILLPKSLKKLRGKVRTGGLHCSSTLFVDF